MTDSWYGGEVTQEDSLEEVISNGYYRMNRNLPKRPGLGGGRCGPRRRKASAEAWKCENSLIIEKPKEGRGVGKQGT